MATPSALRPVLGMFPLGGPFFQPGWMNTPATSFSKVGLFPAAWSSTSYSREGLFCVGAPHEVVQKAMRVKSINMVGYYATLQGKDLAKVSKLAFFVVAFL